MSAKSKNNSSDDGGKRYLALRILSWLYMIAGGLFLIGALVVFAGTLISSGSNDGGLSVAGVGAVTGLNLLIIAVAVIAVGQIIQVVLELVQNSREQTKLLRYIARRS